MGSASPRSGWKQMDSQLMERAEAAEVELLRSILHSLPPIRCAVIGVRVTGRPNLPPHTHHLPTHPFQWWGRGGARLSLLLRFPGENICSWGLRTGGGEPLFTDGTVLCRSAGRLPRWSFNSNTLQMARAPLSFVAKKTCMCHTRVRVLPRR